jgi:hypothetical protein
MKKYAASRTNARTVPTASPTFSTSAPPIKSKKKESTPKKKAFHPLGTFVSPRIVAPPQLSGEEPGYRAVAVI